MKINIKDFRVPQGKKVNGTPAIMATQRLFGFDSCVALPPASLRSSVHHDVKVKAKDTEGQQQLARYMVRVPFSLEKTEYKPDSGMVVYRSKMHNSLKRNYQVMPGAQWLALLLQHVPDKGEHLVRYYGWYRNRSRGIRKQQDENNQPEVILDEAPLDPDFRRSARARPAV